jgi:hypothetical protein
MAHSGISVEECNKRIAPGGGIIEKWPFNDLVPAERYSHTIGHEDAQGLAVGKVICRSGNIVYLSVYLGVDSPVRTRLLFQTPEMAEPWRQLAGVGVALSVRQHRNSGLCKPMYVPQEVIAVEPSLTSPDWLRSVALGSQRDAGLGYMHGIVVSSQSKSPANSWAFSLQNPGDFPSLGIGGSTQQQLFSGEGESLSSLEPRDLVRVRVSESFSPLAYNAMGPVHVLGHDAPLPLPSL